VSVRGGAVAASVLLYAAALAGCSSDDPAEQPAASPSEGTGSSASESAVPDGVTVTELDSPPVGVAAVGDGAWAALPDAGAVRTADGRETAVGALPLRLVETRQGVWVSVIGDGTVVRVDPGSGQVDLRTRVRPAGSEPEGLAYDGLDVWVVDQAGDRVIPIDAASGRLGTPVVVGSEPRLAAAGPDAVYVGNYGDGTVTRVRDGRGRTGRLGSCTSPQGLAVAAGVVWVACTAEDEAVALDAESLQPLAEIPDLEFADAVVATDDAVYVVGQMGPTVWTIDPETRAVTGELVLDEAGPTNENVDAAVVGDSLVVSHPSSQRLYEVPLDLLGG
jgi:hypothetical protein